MKSCYRKLDVKLDEDIEKQEESMNRESIEADKAYEECLVLLKDFDVHNHEFFQEVEDLLNVYADAAENVSNFKEFYFINSKINNAFPRRRAHHYYGLRCHWSFLLKK